MRHGRLPSRMRRPHYDTLVSTNIPLSSAISSHLWTFTHHLLVGPLPSHPACPIPPQAPSPVLVSRRHCRRTVHHRYPPGSARLLVSTASPPPLDPSPCSPRSITQSRPSPFSQLNFTTVTTSAPLPSVLPRTPLVLASDMDTSHVVLFAYSYSLHLTNALPRPRILMIVIPEADGLYNAPRLPPSPQ